MTPLEKLRDIFTDNKTAALITSPVNRRYFTGFSSSDGFVLVTNNDIILFVDFRYYEKAVLSVSKDITLVKYQKAFDSINAALQKADIKELLVEEDDLTLSHYELMKEKLRVELNPSAHLSKTIGDIRMIKTEREIELLTKAQRIAEKAYLEVLNFVKPGVSERKIATELEYLMKLNGAEKVAFDLITITGKKTSMPHGSPGDEIINAGDFFTFDIGAVYEGYHSDMTRTVAVSYATDKMKEIYDIVLTAHNKATEKIIAGNTAADVDNAARDHIASKGFGDYFGHSTGHGVGLDIHEAPVVYKTYDTVLCNNMVITDEPGIYLPGEFGVRIEDMYVVKGNSPYSLASIDKRLVIL